MFSGARFFVTGQELRGILTLGREDSRHIADVLRHRPGDSVVVCDGQGMEADCLLVSVDGAGVSCEVTCVRECAGEPRAKVHLFPSVSKGERFEWMLQKSVELGAVSITPVFSERCVVRQIGDAKLTRWRRIVMEAAKQCGRGIIPPLNAAVTFEEALALGRGFDVKLFCYEEERTLSLQTELSCGKIEQAAVLTGPEGGYTPLEAEAALASGWRSVSLGARILRCETAPLAVLAAVEYR